MFEFGGIFGWGERLIDGGLSGLDEEGKWMGLWWDLCIGKIWDIDLLVILLRDTIGLYLLPVSFTVGIRYLSSNYLSID